ncbi:hypothetical protein RUM44_006006 [Polyplax serrata]|uniref:Ribosomal protein S10 n=1 Tax=Polyplax serrata TaxID=468196 RepID=A0ABR1AYP9_POLSC
MKSLGSVKRHVAHRKIENSPGEQTCKAPCRRTAFLGFLSQHLDLFVGRSPEKVSSTYATSHPKPAKILLSAALSQTTRTPEYQNSRTKQNRTISFKEYIEAELNSKPVFSTNQGKSKDPGFENGSKEVKSTAASTEGARTNSSPRYSFTKPEKNRCLKVELVLRSGFKVKERILRLVAYFLVSSGQKKPNEIRMRVVRVESNKS